MFVYSASSLELCSLENCTEVLAGQISPDKITEKIKLLPLMD